MTADRSVATAAAKRIFPLNAWYVVAWSHEVGTRELTREWSDAGPRTRDAWYYARIVQADGEMAWSSPIFVTLPK